MTGSGHSKLHQIELDARRAGFEKKRRQDDPQAVFWRIRCGCGNRHDAGWGPTTSPDLMVKNMRKKGWEVGYGKSPVCSTCVNTRKNKPNGAAAMSNGTHPSPKITRKINTILEEHFNDKTGMYSNGWSDERVAKEVGTTEKVVAGWRIEAFGELAEHPRITEFAESLQLFEMELQDMVQSTQAQLSKFRALLDNLRSQLGK